MKIYKVIKVIDSRTIVINAGLNQGISSNMHFIIYDVGEKLYDPDTKEELGSLEIVKGKAKVKHIQDNLTTLTSSLIEVKTRKKVRTHNNSAISRFIGDSRQELIYEEDEQVVPFNDVCSGDLVKLI